MCKYQELKQSEPMSSWYKLPDEFPTGTETTKAIHNLSSGKAPGTDAISAEVYKAERLPMAEKVVSMHVEEEEGGYSTRIQGCCHNPSILVQTEKEILKSVITTKASLINCWKDTDKFVLNRLAAHLDQAGLVPESKCGFRQ